MEFYVFHSSLLDIVLFSSCFPCFLFTFLTLLLQELDFLTEAKNSERCLGNFHKLSPHIANYVYAPKVYWNLSTSKLLTMEFMDGAYVNDVKTIQKLGINLHELSTLVSSCLWASL